MAESSGTFQQQASEPNDYNSNSPNEVTYLATSIYWLGARPRVVISKDTLVSDIVDALTENGCRDLTGQIDFTSYSSQPPLRAGGFGNVHRGVLLTTQSTVAIKSLRILVGSDDNNDTLPKHAARELYAWSKCSHPNVLPLLGLAVHENQIRMVSQWMDSGSLIDYLQARPGADRYQMCLQVCDGMRYIHEQSMVHGDMKGQNVLVSDAGVPMITDFGNATVEYGTLSFTTTASASFTARWTAPELLKTEHVVHSREGDVYALGMTILEITTGQRPYSNWTNEAALIGQIVVKNLIPNRPEAAMPPGDQRSDRLWKLLRQCWNSNPTRRPDSAEVHQKFEQIVSGQDANQGSTWLGILGTLQEFSEGLLI